MDELQFLTPDDAYMGTMGQTTRNDRVIDYRNDTHDDPTKTADDVQAAGDIAGKIPVTEAQANGTDPNSTTTESGYRLPVYDNSWGNQIGTSFGTAFMARLAGASRGQAIMAGSKAVQDLNNKSFRSKYAHKLIEEQGASVPDVVDYIETGRTDNLTKNLGYTTRVDPKTGKKVRVSMAEAKSWDTTPKPDIFGSAETGYGYLNDNNDYVEVRPGTGPKQEKPTTIGNENTGYYERQENGEYRQVIPPVGSISGAGKQMVTVTGPGGEDVQIPAETWAAHRKEFGGSGELPQPIKLKDGTQVTSPGVYSVKNDDGTTSHVNVGISARGTTTVKAFSEKEESATQENQNRFADFKATSGTMLDRGRNLAKSGKLHASGSDWADKAWQKANRGAVRENESAIEQYNESLGKATVPVMLKTVGSQRAFASEFNGLGGSSFEKLDPTVSSEENHARIKRNEQRMSVYNEMMSGLTTGEHATLNTPNTPTSKQTNTVNKLKPNYRYRDPNTGQVFTTDANGNRV